MSIIFFDGAYYIDLNSFIDNVNISEAECFHAFQ